MTCINCPAFKICPEKPVRKDYADENKYLIDLECGVWSCQKTIEKLCKENEKNIKLFKELKEHCDKLEKEIEILANHNKELSANLSDAESMITKMICCRNCEQSYKENGELRCDVINCLNFDKWSLAE